MAVRKRNPVLTVLSYLLAIVIAVALVKIAFFPADDTAAQDVGAVPGADFADPTVVPERGDITATVTLDASVQQDPAQEAKAQLAGVIDRVSVQDGATIAAGQEIARVRQEVPVEPRQVTGADGAVTLVPQAPRVTNSSITAPVGGVVDLQALKDQDVSVGAVVASVQPQSNSVVASLSPEQRYRLVNAPADATIELTSGPGVFTCTGVTVGAGPAAAPADPANPGAAAPQNGAQVRCAVPAEVTVFPGLTGKMTLQTGNATGVLILPTTAVQGLYQTGKVWVVADGGAPTPTDVTLGLTDGSRIEITGGIEEGTEVLEYAPVAREDAEGDAGAESDPAIGG